MSTGLDTSVFQQPVSPAEAGSRPGRWGNLGFVPKGVLVPLVAACLAVWLLCSMGIAEAAVDSFGLDAPALNIGSGIFLGGVVAAAIGFILEARGEDPQIATIRVRRFVQQNGLFYQEEATLPKLKGVIFEQGHHARSGLRFRSGPAHPFPFEIAHYSYRTGTERHGPNERPSTTTWTYIALTADRVLPRIVCDARENNHWFVSSVPASLAASQLVPLDGEHEKAFKLYAPEGYEQQARRIFTAEVLGMLRHDAPAFDVETADDQIVFFIRKELDLTREETWQQISRIVFGVGAAMVGLAAHQPADRFGRNATQEVAPAGRTLRRRRITPALLWILAGAVMLVLARVLLTGPLAALF